MRDLYYYTSANCAPCRAMRPIVESLEKNTAIDIHKLDIADHLDEAIKDQVMATPSFVLYIDGKFARKHVGSISYKSLYDFVFMDHQ